MREHDDLLSIWRSTALIKPWALLIVMIPGIVCVFLMTILLLDISPLIGISDPVLLFILFLGSLSLVLTLFWLASVVNAFGSYAFLLKLLFNTCVLFQLLFAMTMVLLTSAHLVSDSFGEIIEDHTALYGKWITGTGSGMLLTGISLSIIVVMVIITFHTRLFKGAAFSFGKSITCTLFLPIGLFVIIPKLRKLAVAEMSMGIQDHLVH